jgi:hypothetical protein
MLFSTIIIPLILLPLVILLQSITGYDLSGHITVSTIHSFSYSVTISIILLQL